MASGWRKDPTPYQQRYYELLGDEYYAYEPNTKGGLSILCKKVGYAIYDVPDEEPNYGNGDTGYSENKYKTIKDVVDFIKEVNKEKTKGRDQLNMAIIFVFVEHKGMLLQFPVFRILLSGNTRKFVDTNCRVYASWKKFLEFNELPEGQCCWPANGNYRGDAKDNVQLGWGLTPAAHPVKKVIEVTDMASTLTTIVASGVFAASWFTPVGPLMTIASAAASVCGTYGVIRSGGTLIDRGNHGQTVNPLEDRQAALSWLSVAGSVLGVVAGEMSSHAASLAKNGEVMSKTGRITCNALNVTSMAVSATELGISCVSLGENIAKDEITTLEVLQFTSSVLFFTHSYINFQTASQVIKESQREVITDFEKSLRSNRHRKQFKKLEENTVATGKNTMDGNAKVIRAVHNIDNKDDFFAGMVRTRKDLSGHKAILSENGNVIVNDGAEVHPMRLYELGKEQRKEFLSSTRQASKGQISDANSGARSDFTFTINTVCPPGVYEDHIEEQNRNDEM